jgi:hypothetical protein
MERYDGKTRKDDIKKWTLIISAVLVLFIGLQVGLHFLKKANAPDYTIVTLCNRALTEAAAQDLTEAAQPIVAEALGKDTAKISVREVLPTASGFDESVTTLFTGDYVLFIIAEPYQFSAEMLPEQVNLAGTKLYSDQQRFGPLYACILSTSDQEMETARQIIAAIKAQ